LNVERVAPAVAGKKQVGFLPILAYPIRAWVHSKNAERQKSTSTNGARSCVCIGTRSARGRSNLPRVFIHPLARLHFGMVQGGVLSLMPGNFSLMENRFDKHYTRDEARALLPQIREWLERLNRLRQDLDRFDKRLSGLTGQGNDVGGETVNSWIRVLADMQGILAEFQRRRIFIKDLSRGLVDFPAIIGGREAFLCWEQEEDDIEFWHDLDAGFGGRERL
jgi:hypothetical protein